MTAKLRSYLKRALFVTFGIGVIIFVVGLISGSFSSTFLFLILLLGTAVISVVGVLFLILLVQGISLARAHDIAWKSKLLAVVASPVLLSALVVTSLPILWSGTYVGSYGKLLLNHPDYEMIVGRNDVQIEGEPFQARRTENGIEYEIDSGPPVRFAFEPDGILDNWFGIVYDPSGDVMLADGFDSKGKFRAPDRVTKLFGGDLVSCSHFFGHYYRCSFT
jgi:hypothetical protein